MEFNYKLILLENSWKFTNPSTKDTNIFRFQHPQLVLHHTPCKHGETSVYN